MSSRVIPGPVNPELLYLHEQHRAYHMFYGNIKDEQLEVRRSDREFWDFVRVHGIPDNVMNIIRDAGFSGVIDCGYRTVDHGLITGLIERWRPETNTFHLPFGEVTVTLQDIQVLWGVPVEGDAVTGNDARRDIDELRYLCGEYLGFLPPSATLKGTKINLSTLLAELKSPLPEDAGPLEFTRRARLYILHLIGGTLCPDKSGCKMSLMYLENLVDLSSCGKLSWGSAILACLYRNLYKAAKSSPVTSYVAGPMSLLQLWAWERIPSLAPRPKNPNETPRYQLPYGSRWNTRFEWLDTPAHVLRAARYALSVLTEKDFEWTPYAHVLRMLPQWCTNGERSWRSNTYLIFWEIVEEYSPGRVLRQFKLVQPIPPNPQTTENEYGRLRLLNKVNNRYANWETKLQKYINIWNARHEAAVNGVTAHTFTRSREYRNWFWERTVIYITNPGVENPRGFQNHAGSFEVLMEGMTYMHNQNFATTNEMQNIAGQYMGLINANNRMQLEARHVINASEPFVNPPPPQFRRRREHNVHFDAGGPSTQTTGVVASQEEYYTHSYSEPLYTQPSSSFQPPSLFDRPSSSFQPPPLYTQSTIGIQLARLFTQTGVSFQPPSVQPFGFSDLYRPSFDFQDPSQTPFSGDCSNLNIDLNLGDIMGDGNSDSRDD